MAYTVDITDLSQKFVDFYNSSVAEHADPDRRWELWKSKYNFAAVPNISAGQKMAREQLDAAWAKYPEAMSQIRLGATALTPSPQERLTKVAELLGVQGGPIRIRLIAFVGTFRRNAFSMGVKDGVSTIAIPLEDSAQDHALGMTHEFTHAVQMQEGGWNGQSVASTTFAEGLAMRVTEHLNPGFPENIYTGSPAWLEKCKASLPQVLNELKEHGADSGAEAVSKFTYGTGTAGISREVYCSGWFVVGRMLSDGASFSTLGRMTEAEAEARVAATIDSLLTSSAPAAYKQSSLWPSFGAK